LKISDDSYEFDSIEDIKEIYGDRVKKFTIRADKFAITLEFGSIGITRDVTLYTSNETDEARILFYELKEFLQQRVSWFARIINPFRGIFICVFFLMVTTILTPFLKSGYIPLHIVLTLDYIALTFLVVTIISFIYYQRGTTIFLVNKHNIDFWKLNKDKIVVGIIVAIFTILATLLVQKLFK
jgi:hypothetical protein